MSQAFARVSTYYFQPDSYQGLIRAFPHVHLPLLLLLALVASIPLSGCDATTPDVNEDKPYNEEPQVGDKDSYVGQVIASHPVSNATVWLDLNNNRHYDEQEPVAKTNGAGRFNLDLTQINAQRSANNQPEIDPKTHSLYAFVLRNEGRLSNGQTVDASFLLSAPAGTQLISPLTTLITTERDFSFGSQSTLGFDKALERSDTAHNLVRKRLNLSDNLRLNYLTENDARLEAYAGVIEENLKRSFPAGVEAALLNENYNAVSSEMIDQISRFSLSQAKALFRQVDVLAGADQGNTDYVSVDTNRVDYQPVVFDFSNPFLRYQELNYKLPAQTDGESFEPIKQFETAEVSTAINYNYQSDASLRNVSVDGYVAFPQFALFNDAELGSLLATEFYQFWGVDDVDEQVISLSGSLYQPLTMLVDSRHPRDHRPGISAKAAKDLLESQPDTYGMDGIAEYRYTFNYSDDRLVSIEGRTASDGYTFSYDSEGRIALISAKDDSQRWEFDYAYEKRIGNIHVAIEKRIDFYQRGILKKQFEYYLGSIITNGQEREVVTQIFITDVDREVNQGKHLIWVLDYYDSIDIAKEREIDLPRRLSHDRLEDLTLASSLLETNPYLILEGKLQSAELVAATKAGTRSTALSLRGSYVTHVYKYGFLADFVFGL